MEARVGAVAYVPAADTDAGLGVWLGVFPGASPPDRRDRRGMGGLIDTSRNERNRPARSSIATLPDVMPAARGGRAVEALTIEQLSDLVGRIADRPDVWLPMLRLPESGQRWWTRLSSDLRVDVWLLSWLPGHATDLHDHGVSAAAFTVVRGELTEVRVTPNGPCARVPRPRGSMTTVGAGVIHDVLASGSQPAVSIHAYSPPLAKMTYYEIDPRGRARATSTLETAEPELEPNPAAESNKQKGSP